MGLSSYRLSSKTLFTRPNEDTIKPKRVVFLSTEGTKTEVQYFRCVERFKEQLRINAIVHIEVLERNDTRSDVNSVLDLLDEYVYFRENNKFEDIINSFSLKNFSIEFINTFKEEPSKLDKKEVRRFKEVLKEEHIDLLYLNFLNKYQGDDDIFGIVIDRDCGSHTLDQMTTIIEKCQQKGYHYFISNPCFEFWLLLHVSDVANEYSECLNKILDNETDEKGNTFVSNLLFEKTGQRKAIQVKIFEQYYLPNIDLAIERAKTFGNKDQLLDSVGTNIPELFEHLRQ